MAYKRLGDLLTSVGAISEEQLNTALALQKESKKRLGSILIESGIITEDQLIETLQLQLGVDYIDLAAFRIQPDLAQALSKNIARKYTVIPVKNTTDEIHIAMADPMNFMAIEEVKAATHKRVVPLIARQHEIERAISNLYGTKGATQALEDLEREMGASTSAISSFQGPLTTNIAEDTNSAPTIRLVNSIIERAITDEASDIHLEPREETLVVRMRVDGVLRVALTIPRTSQSAVISRIKIMGNMDIAERRVPQDGRANVRIRNMNIDLRISTLPTIYGEKVVIRLLNKSGMQMTTSGIGLEGKNLTKYNRLMSNSNGVILLVGPTGSGKTSTLYTMIHQLNTDEVNLVTLEDPVEYNVAGINQVQINDKTGLTFAGGLRSILRQDPDIVAIGEIRDGETAEIAMRAAITGHLVLSTMHTNDAIASLDRLIDIGVEPYLIASAVKGIISQRLVRRVCPHCNEKYDATDTELDFLGIPHTDENGNRTQLTRGKGCPYCNGTGYRGRIAVFEILMLTNDIANLVHRNAPHEELLEKIYASDFEPMVVNCRKFALNGITSSEEAFRILNTTEM